MITILFAVVAIAAADYPPYVPTTDIDLAGEVFDIYLCEEASNVDTRPQPGCRYVQTQTVWVEDMDNQGRARVRIDGSFSYVIATRVLINCKGTSTTLRSFWNDSLDSFDFRSCR
jgi:membrane protein implicated in regulation of membrane protease activity